MFAHPDDVLVAHRDELTRRTDAHLMAAHAKRSRPPDTRAARGPRAAIGQALITLGHRLQRQTPA